VTYFKVLTHDFRPPVQGGDPVWDGETLPFALPATALDTSSVNCGTGWNYTDDLATALKIARLWPDGRPSLCLYVEPSADAVVRGDKHRCSVLTITGRVPREEVLAAFAVLSKPFGEHAEAMAFSQFAWYEALGRPSIDAAAVETFLRAALDARGLGGWKLKRFDSAWAAWAARDAWDAWAARDAWDAWAARDAWAAWAARDARDAWDARAAWAAWAARAARAARDAWDALTVEYAALNGWTKDDPQLLTTGLRDAYAAGLGIAIPVGPSTLGWAMA
jgi:hypothetical protein